jgi:lysophospholipase L1-like esterase
VSTALFAVAILCNSLVAPLVGGELFGRRADSAPPAAHAEPFQDGDVVCFVGDSITRGGWYHSFVQQFYATRYPQEKIVGFNCGHSGDVASGVLRRLDWDVLAHKPTVAAIMLGMNDAPANGSQASAIKKYAEVAEKLRAAGARIVVIGPSIYEETATLAKAANVGKNAALGRFTDGLAELARTEDYEFIPLHDLMDRIDVAGQKSDPAFTIVGEDRVHPGEVGHLIMAYGILKAQGVSGDVAQIVIDAKEESVAEEVNCTVEQLVVKRGEVSFTCTEQALPFVPTEKSRAALELVPFQEELNREMLIVRGLPEGTYVLQIDDATVGEYDAKDLATGVNLASNDKTPQYQTSARITKNNARRHDIESVAVRGVSFIRYSVLDKAGIDPINTAAVDAKLRSVLAERADEPESFGTTMIKRYLDQWGPKYEQNLALMASLTAEIDADRKPKPHAWKLTRK